jgi:hypothetical protein
MYVYKILFINFTVLTCIPNLIFRIFIVVTVCTIAFIVVKVTTDFIVTLTAKVTTVPRLLWLREGVELFSFCELILTQLLLYISLCDYT